jgi:hypothetical protein
MSAPALTTTQKLEAIGVEVICERVANCEFLQVIADDYDVPRSTMTKWLQSDANAVLYACAREAQADKMAEDILAIADDGKSDTYTDADGNIKTDQDVIGRSRLRVDARKWLAAKMAPKKYGDKLQQDITITDNTPMADRMKAARERSKS